MKTLSGSPRYGVSPSLFQNVWGCNQELTPLTHAQDLRLVGQEPQSGCVPSHPLNIPMITLNLITELRSYGPDPELYADVARACIPLIRMHVHEDLKVTLETVGPHGVCV